MIIYYHQNTNMASKEAARMKALVATLQSEAEALYNMSEDSKIDSIYEELLKEAPDQHFLFYANRLFAYCAFLVEHGRMLLQGRCKFQYQIASQAKYKYDETKKIGSYESGTYRGPPEYIHAPLTMVCVDYFNIIKPKLTVCVCLFCIANQKTFF